MLEILADQQWHFDRVAGTNAFVAVDPVQDFQAMLGENGFSISGPLTAPEWTTRIELTTLEREGSCAPWAPIAPSAQANELLWHGQGIDIQYLHGPNGLRQNFIIRSAPEGAGTLNLSLTTSGDLTPSERGDGMGVSFFDDRDRLRFTYDDLKVWDHCGVILPARILVSGPRLLTISVIDAGATYPITVDPVSSTPNRTLLGTTSGGEFGFTVATAGDVNGDGYSDVIVGAPLATVDQATEGAAFVYYGSSTGIGASPDIILHHTMASANFGYSVASAGDVNGDGYSDVIVGSTKYTNNAATQSREGGAFIYHGSATGLTNTPAVILQTNQADTYLGYSVAGVGDINGDGYSDVIAGAYLANYGQGNEGAAFVHLGGAGGVNPTALHRLERNQDAAQFGSSCAGAGDVNGDGYNDVIIATTRFNLFGVDDGAAFVYHGGPSGLGAGLNPAPTLIFNSSGTSSYFGYSAACAGDVNGDGYSDIIVGDWRDNIGGQVQEGTAMVFHGSATGINTTPVTVIQNNQNYAFLGRSVSTAGDVNGDGYADVIIGSITFTNGQTAEGAAYVHLGSPAGISATPFLRYEGDVADVQLGQSVATAGDVNGDGYSDMIVGIFKQTGSIGAARIYHGGTYNVATAPTLSRYSGIASAAMGTSVANAGDINGDGYSDVVIGAPDAGNGQAGEGLAYVHYGSTTGLPAVPSLTLEANVANARFGASVASAGDVNGDGYADVVVGAPLSGGTGRAYLYLGGAGGLATAPVMVWTGTAGSEFGAAVSTAGDVNADGYAEVLVGAPGADAAFLFQCDQYVGIPAAATATIPSPQSGARFGAAVATAGDVNGDGQSDMIIGAPLFSNGQANEGAAFVFLGTNGQWAPSGSVLLERNQANARFGSSVAGAGDVNGDGFYEVVVGADAWSNGQALEGSVSLYYGTPAGTNPVAGVSIESNLAGIRFGTSVAEAGDINGDGYADIVIGAPNYTNAQANEGRVYVYLGGPVTLISNQAMEVNVVNALMGTSVAGGGDVDGDGYSDIVCGAPGASPSFANEGAAFAFHGNQDRSIDRLSRQYLADLISPLSTNSVDFAALDRFGIGHRARSNMQRTQTRLRWEVVHEGQPFSGTPITNSVQSTGTGAAWTTLPLTGTEIKQLVIKAPNRVRYKWRVRVEYRMNKLLDGQRFSRWFYGYASGIGDIGILPVELILFQGQPIETGNHLQWTTASESGSHRFVVERGATSERFEDIGELPAAGNSSSPREYTFLDDRPLEGTQYYRLRMEDLNGDIGHSPVISMTRRPGEANIWPNPVSGILNWNEPTGQARTLRILDMAGKQVLQVAVGPARDPSLDLSNLAAGSYTLLLLDSEDRPLSQARFIR